MSEKPSREVPSVSTLAALGELSCHPLFRPKRLQHIYTCCRAARISDARLGNAEDGCRDKAGSARGKRTPRCWIRAISSTEHLHQPRVETAAAHPSICSLTSEGSWQPRIGIRGIATNPGYEPGFKVLPAVNDATPKLAVDKAISGQAQLSQRARRSRESETLSDKRGR
jgi:hypothetical protein